jgi:hypothetical protein
MLQAARDDKLASEYHAPMFTQDDNKKDVTRMLSFAALLSSRAAPSAGSSDFFE